MEDIDYSALTAEEMITVNEQGPVQVGQIYQTRKWGQAEVIHKDGCKRITVRFLNTGYTTLCQSSRLRRGQVKDLLAPNIAGVGYFGVGPHKERINGKTNPAYKTWSSMIRRCYKSGTRHYRYYGDKGVTVCEDWHNFQNFAEWFDENYIEGYSLDKDILSGGAKQYSPQNCVFVPQRINALLVGADFGDGRFRKGYFKVNGYDRCRVKVNIDGRPTFFGGYSSPQEAFMVYKREKEAFIQKVAQAEFDKGTLPEPVYNALMAWEILPCDEDKGFLSGQ